MLSFLLLLWARLLTFFILKFLKTILLTLIIIWGVIIIWRRISLIFLRNLAIWCLFHSILTDSWFLLRVANFLSLITLLIVPVKILRILVFIRLSILFSMTRPSCTTLYLIHFFQLGPVWILWGLGILITQLFHASRRSLFTSKDVDRLFWWGLSCWRFVHHTLDVIDVLIQIAYHAINLWHHSVPLHLFALIAFLQEAAVVGHNVMVRVHAATDTWTSTCSLFSIGDSDRFDLCHRISLNCGHKVGIIDIWTNNFGRCIIFYHLAFLIRWIPLRRRSLPKRLPILISFFFVVFIFVAVIWIASAIALIIFSFLVFAVIRLPVCEELLLEVENPWMLEYLYQWNSLIWVLLEELFDKIFVLLWDLGFEDDLLVYLISSYHVLITFEGCLSVDKLVEENAKGPNI